MLKLTKSPLAKADLFEIWFYIAEDQPLNADRYLRKLNDAAVALSESPGIGADRPSLGEGIKCYPVDRYLLIYRVSDVELELLRVLSASRDVESLF